MKTKYVSPVLYLILGLSLLTIGILIIAFPQKAANTALLVARIITLALGVSTLWACFFDKQKKVFISALNAVLYIVFAVLLFFMPNVIAASIPRLAGLWALINFVIYGVSGVLLFLNNAPGRVWSIIRCMISLAFTIIFIFGPTTNLLLLTILCGIYMIIFSLYLFSDFIRDIFHLDINGKFIPKKIHISLPAFLAAFIPQRMLDRFNKTYETAPSEIPLHQISGPELAPQTAGDLEIFVHMSPETAMGFGHVDFAFNGTTYTYGTYDESSTKLLGLLSDGVLVEAPKQEYIQYCIGQEKKMLVGYKVFLSPENNESLKQGIGELKNSTHSWQCILQRDPHSATTDPASNLYRVTRAKFNKFKKGGIYRAFRIYFAFTTNCVFLVDSVLYKSGLDILGIQGIITPGSYYARLDYLFQRQNSVVYEKTIYKDFDGKKKANQSNK